jgi:hypothetical protein
MFFRLWIVCALLILAFFTPGNSRAQTSGKAGEPPAVSFDTNYLKDYTQLLTTRLFLLFENASLLINPSDNIPKIVYQPNVNVRVGFAGFWKWFGIGLSIDNPFYKTDQERYGKTTTLDLRVNAFGRSVAGEFFFSQYKGFYISTPEKSEDVHYILPDMRTLSVGIAGYWIYNSGRFSIRAAFIQNERQKKSAGSFLVRPSFLYYQISSDNGIIPAEIVSNYSLPPSSQITGGTFYSVGLSPGYIYTLVFLKNFSCTAVVFPGVAAQFSTYSNETGKQSHSEINFQLSGRFALGYNSDKWFLGASVQEGFNEVPDKLSNALISYDVAQFRFWGGTRFDVFRKKKKVAKLN